MKRLSVALCTALLSACVPSEFYDDGFEEEEAGGWEPEDGEEVELGLPKLFFEQEVLKSGLDQPTAMVFADDRRIFVAEKKGRVRVVTLAADGVQGKLLEDALLDAGDLKVNSKGQRGLLGLALDPNFAMDPYLYVYYTYDEGDGKAHNQVSRFRLDGNSATGDEQVLVELPALDSDKNNGGGLEFGPEGELYVGVGDNEKKASAQDLMSPLGKILRMAKDVQRATPSSLIYARGLRDPFSLAMEKLNSSGVMFVNDVGADKAEEINMIAKDANFGWPNSEGATKTSGETTPIHTYKVDKAPADAKKKKKNCAIVGGAFYPAKGPFGKPYDDGDYFFVDYCGSIRSLDKDKNWKLEGGSFAEKLINPVALRVFTDGFLYYLSHNEEGGNKDTGSLRRIRIRTGEDPPPPEKKPEEKKPEEKKPEEMKPEEKPKEKPVVCKFNEGLKAAKKEVLKGEKATFKVKFNCATGSLKWFRDNVVVDGQTGPELSNFPNDAGTTAYRAELFINGDMKARTPPAGDVTVAIKQVVSVVEFDKPPATFKRAEAEMKNLTIKLKVKGKDSKGDNIGANTAISWKVEQAEDGMTYKDPATVEGKPSFSLEIKKLEVGKNPLLKFKVTAALKDRPEINKSIEILPEAAK